MDESARVAAEVDHDRVGRRLDEMQAVIDAQAATIALLQARMDRTHRVDRRETDADGDADARLAVDASTRSAADAANSDLVAPASPRTPTSRRDLMSKGAVAAAGAAIAGTALNVATASPAAAAPGFFDGDPAVTGSADPNTGTGVLGAADATTGESIGVNGQAASPGGFGVKGENFASTGEAVGVRGYSGSVAGRGVSGIADASSGATVGVAGLVESPTGTGVQGVSSSWGTTGKGVEGRAESSTGANFGVHGTSLSDQGVGVFGVASASSGGTAGVVASSSSPQGFGVMAFATQGVGVRSSSARSQLLLVGAAAAPLGAGLARSAGEIVLDTNKDLWLCVAAGQPGTWRRISGPSTAGAFVPLPAPVRVYDSRPGFNPNIGPKTKLVPATPRSIDCTLNSSGVPVGASGVLVNLVSTGTSSFGDMAIYKDGIPYPGTSNLNFFGQTIAVTTFSAVSTSAMVAVRSNVACDVVLDVLGYYQ